MAKKNIHPQWYEEAKFYCNGEIVKIIGSTRMEINADIWSGNHPFYIGTQKIVDTEGRIDKFIRKYNLNSENSESL
uniref:Large ribosomal subunit protein bL31c n=1 Tax=Cyanidium caldarium TaxID=2771 RepID=RK31_CYACA|nr:ribosomal protein L31 [Cyanidium caldarium]Q9TLV5.1 RecName: Full=Large ribosomal subunit protein bL31c; AltName: Full=50S ribosomal protein L31, chloroplastic [Cyanidium caldarium]AAF12931.1 unknown [Cyanidium caldarium]WDB00288.1 ribosomal protein L31 [Cyanidium caldarium]